MKTTIRHCTLVTLLALLAVTPAARAQITFTNIADSDSPTYNFIYPPSFNTAGTLGFFAFLDAGSEGLFTSDGTTTTTIGLTMGPTYSVFPTGLASINAGGTLGFVAVLDSGEKGLFTSDGTTTTTIALSTEPNYLSFDGPSLNAAGTVGFFASLESGEKASTRAMGRRPRRSP